MLTVCVYSKTNSIEEGKVELLIDKRFLEDGRYYLILSTEGVGPKLIYLSPVDPLSDG